MSFKFVNLCLALLSSGCSTDGGFNGDNAGWSDSGAGGGAASETGVGGGTNSMSGGASFADSPGLPIARASAQAQPSGAVGGLRVLDWAGFDAALSYSFDDSNSSQINNYETLQSLGVPMTFYLQTGKSDSTNDVWKQALADGHELGNHTHSHKQSGDDLAEDTDAATAFIEATFGITPLSMASPFGALVYASVAESRFLLNRGVSSGKIAPGANTSPFKLPCYSPKELATAADMSTPVDGVMKAGAWQIYLLHGFTGGSDGAYQPVEISEFVTSVEYAKSFGTIWIDTVLEVGAYWIAQKIIDETSPVVEGDTSTWTWFLPPHFPAGRHVRVTVDGGTVSQLGKSLIWDEHGYYEVSLDAGSLTLNP